jgi:hypothetical protein
VRTYVADSDGRNGRDLAAVGREVGNDAFTVQPLRLLLSYHYYKDEDLDTMLRSCFGELPLDLFADSGAYSAFTLGGSVDPAKYTAWVNRWKHRFTAVAGPDVIGDADATTRANEKMMADLPDVKVLPTYHVGEPWEHLRYWVGKVDYLAFGGMVPYSRDRGVLDRWIDKAFSMLPAEMRVHGFGMTNWDLMKKFPYYSVDSSSWTSVFRFGNLSLFDDARGAWVQIDLRKPKDALKHSRILAAYGLRPTDIKSKGYDRDRICGASVFAWRRAEAWLNARRGEQRAYLSLGSADIEGAPNRPAGVARGVKNYLVTAGETEGSNNSPAADSRGTRAYLVASSPGVESHVGSPMTIGHGLRSYLVSKPGGETTPNSPEANGLGLKEFKP